MSSTLRPRRSRWTVWLYLIVTSLIVIAAGLSVVLRHIQDLNEQIDDTRHDLRVQQRTSLNAMVDRVDDLSIDPRPALSHANDAQHVANELSLPAKRLEGIIESLPTPFTVPGGSVVTVHQVFSQAPAIVAEISIVDAEGRFIEGINRVDVEVFNGKRRLRQLQIAQARRSAQAQAIAVLLDCSKSMEGEPLTTAKLVSQTFAKDLANPARIQLWQFSDTATSLTPWTFDSNVISEAIRPLTAQAGTALYLAIQQAVESLSQRSEHRSLVVLTDGEDSHKKITPDSLAELCRQHHVILHAVALGNPQKGFGTLEMLATQTGGTFYSAATASKLSPAFHQLAETLRKPMYRIVILDAIDPNQPLMLRIDGLTETALRLTNP